MIYLEIHILPNWLILPRVGGLPQFNLLGELKNIYVKIPLLQALQDIPIYDRTIRDLCTKKPGKKPRDPPTVHVIGKLFALITGKTLVTKYDDPGNPAVTVQIGHTQIPNVLVDLGAAINVMTIDVEIEPSDRTITLTTIINCTCKITHKRDWICSWTLNCINLSVQ